MPSSPYNYNLPVSDEMFFGRQADLVEMVDGLTATPGDSFALTAGRRMGKTSLLEAVERTLLPSNSSQTRMFLIVPLPFDFTGEEIDSVAKFFDLVHMQARDKLKDLLLAAEIAPFTAEVGQPPAPALRRALEAWGRVIVDRTGQRLRLVLLLDECEQIVDHAWTPELYNALRYLLVGKTTRSLIKVVLCGSHRFLTQVRQEGSPLRNILKYHALQVLDRTSTLELISKPTGNILADNIMSSIADQSGGHPFLTQYLMHELGESGFHDVSTNAIEKVVAKFHHKRHDFGDWLGGLGQSGPAVYRLIVENDGLFSEEAIRAATQPNASDLAQVLDALCYHGLITCEANGKYRVAGKMFQEWFMVNVAPLLQQGRVTHFGWQDDPNSLRHRLDDLRENLQIIEEQKSKHVMDVEVSLQLIKQERHTRSEIVDLERRLSLDSADSAR